MLFFSICCCLIFIANLPDNKSGSFFCQNDIGLRLSIAEVSKLLSGVPQGCAREASGLRKLEYKQEA